MSASESGSGARGVRYRVTWMTAVLAMLFAGTICPIPANGRPAESVAAASGRSASEQAAVIGEPVEVLSKRTERSQVFANPSGTFTLEQSMTPVRVQTPQGWQDIDPTLAFGTDGLVRPRATAIGMAFSGGGSSPLVTLTEDGEQLGVRWPTALPVPVIEGDTLTYASVLPDVDLKVTVSADAYTQVLIVHTPAAARQVALQKIVLGLAAPRLAVRRGASGGIHAVDPLGNTVFESPPPTMWDSSGSGATDGPEADDRTAVPLDGDKVVAMPLELTTGAVAVTPVRSMIDDPSTVYPLQIDPGFSGKQAGHAMIDRAHPTSPYWGWTGDQAVGYQNYDAWSHKRLMFSFWIAAIAGSDVTSAVFRANQVYSASCTESEVQAWEVNKFTSSATWSNASGSNMWIRKVSHATTPGSGRVGCEPGKVIEFNVTGLLDQRVGQRSNYAYLGLRAADEASPHVWKRFTNNASLGIEYNHPPDRPTADDLSIGYGNHEFPCVTSTTGYPTTGEVPTTLRAFLTDRDGGAGQKVSGEFEVYTPDGNRLVWNRSVALLPGRDFSPSMELRLPDGVYWWHVRVSDGISQSAWSPTCFFRVDLKAPPGPYMDMLTAPVPCPDQPDGLPEIQVPCYRIGQSVTFDLVARVELASRFGWSVNTPEQTVSAPAVDGGRRATVTTTLTNFGPTKIYGWAWDLAGHYSPRSGLSIYVIDSERTGGWPIDEGQGTVLNDTIGTGVNTPMTISPSVTWGPGENVVTVPTDRSVFVNGATDGTGGTASTTAMDIVNTAQSFAVSARIMLSPSYTGRQVAVSEDRTGVSGFSLGVMSQTRDADGDRKVDWAFCIANPDAALAEGCVRAAAPMGYDDGDWVSLTGIYDAAGRRLLLYVDGMYVAQRKLWTTRQTVDGDGRFRIGRSVDENAAKYHMRAYIDDVSVFNGYINYHTIWRLFTEK